MKKLSLYVIITIISVIVRQFFLPNPFECFGDIALLINWIAEPIIQVVAYRVVGMFYDKGSAPVIGSLLYMITYALIIGLLWMLGIFSFALWWVLIIVVATAALICGGIWLKERLL